MFGRYTSMLPIPMSADPGAETSSGGRLDVMGASQGVLTLDARPSEIVTALWGGEEPVETLREFFNRDVVVEGVGVFRPSGSLLRVDADAIVLAASQDEFFRRVPSAAAKRDYHELVRLQTSREILLCTAARLVAQRRVRRGLQRRGGCTALGDARTLPARYNRSTALDAQFTPGPSDRRELSTFIIGDEAAGLRGVSWRDAGLLA
jgi:hypothetical protein